MSDAAPKLTPLSIDECRPDIHEHMSNARAATGGADNLFATMARYPGLFKRYALFAGKLLSGGKLPATDRELAILRTAHRCDSGYEWAQHIRIGAQVGLTDDQIDRVREESLDGWMPHESALLRATDQLVADHRMADDTWDVLAAHYDEQQLIELMLLVGSYAMLAGFINTVGIQVEE